MNSAPERLLEESDWPCDASRVRPNPRTYLFHWPTVVAKLAAGTRK